MQKRYNSNKDQGGETNKPCAVEDSHCELARGRTNHWRYFPTCWLLPTSLKLTLRAFSFQPPSHQASIGVSSAVSSLDPETGCQLLAPPTLGDEAREAKSDLSFHRFLYQFSRPLRCASDCEGVLKSPKT